MSDQSNYPSESMPGQDNGFRPLSNADENSDLSRIMSRAGIALANGFPLDDDDDDEEEVDEDYVSVDQDNGQDYPYWYRRPHTHNRTKLDEMHPFVQLLSVSNVDDCVKVEEAFPEQERCSHDKVWLPLWTFVRTTPHWNRSPIMCSSPVALIRCRNEMKRRELVLLTEHV
jgi:hypothetical protein